MPTLLDRAALYGVNTTRPYFPVNSLRLMYFTISDYFSQNNETARDQIGSLIPKVEAFFAARTQLRSEHPETLPHQELEQLRPMMEEIYAVVDTPVVRAILVQMITNTLPLQEQMFLSLYHDIAQDTQLNAQHLSLLLHTRAMDSLLFSTLIAEVLKPYIVKGPNPGDSGNVLGRESENQHISFEHAAASLNWHIHLSYQLNDMVDTVVFAKEDLEAESFSPFQVIRKIAPDATAAKELIKNTLEKFATDGQSLPFPTELQQDVSEFYTALVGTVLHPQ